ncbi:MAG: hypothetical protein QOI59_2820 [Gammaproteobacteria bacterium]|jgi:NAD(P)-dependent dehydrogenase (short-subunit alcohol dehydrogenase family)|nr:hypothetical protein [Gammaproteobacteria bacterium]
MTQRTWFITGVNSGFGRLMTEQLLARGDRVAGTVRKMDRRQLGPGARAEADRSWHRCLEDHPEGFG